MKYSSYAVNKIKSQLNDLMNERSTVHFMDCIPPDSYARKNWIKRNRKHFIRFFVYDTYSRKHYDITEAMSVILGRKLNNKCLVQFGDSYWGTSKTLLERFQKKMNWKTLAMRGM